jgi:diguanylate cyclase (GGDEF)-like protein/PAS domain S-box-containing protein
MIQEAQQQNKQNAYRNVALIVTTVFVVLVVASSLMVVGGKRRFENRMASQSFATEQLLLKHQLHELLLRYDFVQMRTTLESFFDRHGDYVSIQLQGANGATLLSVVRPSAKGGELRRAHVQIGDARNYVVLNLEKMDPLLTPLMPYSGWATVVVLVLIGVVLGRLTWLLIKRIGLDPLYSEIVREQRYYRSLFDLAQEAIFILSPQGELLRLNRAARRLFHLPETMPSSNLRQFHSPQNWLKVDAFIEKIRQRGRHSEKVFLAPLDICVEIIGSQIMMEEETLIQLLVLDVTKQHYAQIQLNRLQGELERSLNEYRTLFDYSVDGLTVRNQKGELLLCNKPYETIVGRSFEELNHGHFIRMCSDQDQELLLSNYQRALRGENVLFEFSYYRKDGQPFPVEIRSSLIEFRGETCVLSAVRDISERRDRDQRLRELSAVLDHSNDAVMIMDDHGQILAVNKTFCIVSGYREEDVLGKNPDFLKSEIHSEKFYIQLFSQLHSEGSWQGEVWIRDREGLSSPQWLQVTKVENTEDQTIRYVAVGADLSEEKDWEEKMLQLAQTDPLTGAANRVLFRDRLQQAIMRARNRSNVNIQVYSVDLDHFKRINDSLGHVAGDRMLIEVASRIKQTVRGQDTFSRMSSDEFAVLVTCLEGEVDASRVANQLLDAISMPMEIDGAQLQVTASIGIALYPEDGSDDLTLLANADNAMHQAKREGRNRVCYFSNELAVKAQEFLLIESQLRYALQNEELQLYFQPQVELATGAIVAAEALLRWQNDALGWVSPDRMIPVAEESGLILPIGGWIIEQGCRVIHDYHQRSGRWFPIAVNVSARQFLEVGFVDMVEEIVQRHDVPPEVLELELTESLMLDDVDKALATMKELDRRGFKLALDDFGTGYTSLAYLKSFPVDKIKLDRTFVTDVHRDINDAALAEALVSFTRVMNMSLVAEGIEEFIQLNCLNQMGFRFGQGFLFSKPLPEQDFIALLEDNRPLFDVENLSGTE